MLEVLIEGKITAVRVVREIISKDGENILLLISRSIIYDRPIPLIEGYLTGHTVWENSIQTPDPICILAQSLIMCALGSLLDIIDRILAVVFCTNENFHSRRVNVYSEGPHNGIDILSAGVVFIADRKKGGDIDK